MISIRLFLARPAGILLSAIGSFGPWPLTISRRASTPRDTSDENTD